MKKYDVLIKFAIDGREDRKIFPLEASDFREAGKDAELLIAGMRLVGRVEVPEIISIVLAS